MLTSNALIILVLILCGALFLKVSKTILKTLIIVGAIALIVVKFLPQFL